MLGDIQGPGYELDLHIHSEKAHTWAKQQLVLVAFIQCFIIVWLRSIRPTVKLTLGVQTTIYSPSLASSEPRTKDVLVKVGITRPIKAS